MTLQRRPVRAGKRLIGSLLAVCLVLPASVLQAQEWTRFRGPNGQGISNATTIPVNWTQNDYNWKIELPGGGHSSPVLWGNTIFVTCGNQKTGQAVLLAVSASDGSVLWQKQYALAVYRMNKLNSYATSTPVMDAEHVYVLWATPQQSILAALDHRGTEIWRRTFEGVRCQHGAGSSPMVYGDEVVFTHEHELNRSKGAKSFWMALDCKTGRTLWTLDRRTGPKTSYSTPCVYTPASEAPQLIFASNAHGMTGVDPDTGKVIWEVASAFPARVVSSPVIANGLLIGSCGDGGAGKRLIAIRPGTRDGSVQAAKAYSIDSGVRPYVPTSVTKDGLLFTFHDQGYVSCLRAATGERIWQEKPAGRFFSSPVWVDGRLYCITVDGDVVVLKAADTYELLAVNPLGEGSHATPAVAGGRMYLRTYSHLFSIGGKK
jgi:outer membrane protein assembly factor BamB